MGRPKGNSRTPGEGDPSESKKYGLHPITQYQGSYRVLLSLFHESCVIPELVTSAPSRSVDEFRTEETVDYGTGH